MSAGVAVWAVQVGVVAALDAALDVSVYDEVPPGSVMPYVQVGDITSVPDNTMGKTGRECTVTLHVWSDYEGAMEAAGIGDDVDAALDSAALTVAGYTVIDVWFDAALTAPESDGKTRHHVLRYRIKVMEA